MVTISAQTTLRILVAVQLSGAMASLFSRDRPPSSETFPIIIGSHKEVESLRGQIQQTHRSAIDSEPLERNLLEFLNACPADALILIDQPGVSSEDFKLNGLTSSLWTQFARYFHRCGTLMPYMQTQVSLDFDKIAQHYITHCQAEVIVADLTKSNSDNKLIDHYADSRRRVIKLKFPELPEDIIERQDALFDNDLLIHEIVSATPSPFFSIIYTNSQGANTTVPPGLYSEYYIINELVRESKNPSNRDLWKKHAPPEDGTYLGNLGDIKPPLVQHRRNMDRKKAREEALANKKQRLESGSEVEKFIERLDSLLSIQYVMLAMFFSVSGWVIYAIIRLFMSLFKGTPPVVTAKVNDGVQLRDAKFDSDDDGENYEANTTSGSASTGNNSADEAELIKEAREELQDEKATYRLRHRVVS